MPSKLQKFKKLDSKKVGRWLLDGKELSFELDGDGDAWKEQDALYGFFSRNKPLYIGKAKDLRKRLDQYKSPHPKQPTNIKCNRKIKAILRKGESVLIYAFTRRPRNFRGFLLSAIAGLEDSVIQTLQPEWNEQGREKRK
jgi:hypothetical protein